MHKHFFLIFTFSLSLSYYSQGQQNFTDPRDGNTYKTVTLKVMKKDSTEEERTWFAENLKFVSEHSECYKLMDEFCEQLGRLYNWHDAHESCPEGWHVPNIDEWMELFREYGGIKKAGAALRPDGESGFNAQFGGLGDTNNKFYSAGHIASYWDSESHHVTDNTGGAIAIHYQLNDITHSAVSNRNRNSVRCIKDYPGM